MYALLGTDALLRILAALAVLVLGVPALARRRPSALDRFEWFWWCLAAATIGVTLLGQLLTLLNIFSTLTLVLAIGVVVLATRAHVSGRTPVALLFALYRTIVVAWINILEGRVHLRRRIRRSWRRTGARLRASLGAPVTRWSLAGWALLVSIAASLRLIRPFATANLGFSDTYAHLYLFRLLEQGRQVDPAWGPYPRGMHFLLMAIHQLTNVDAILLMNFFGAVAGVLMTLAVTDATRRLSGSLRAGLLAGLLFATMTGGAAQYFLLGSSVVTADPAEGRRIVALPYDAIPAAEGEYDTLQTVFLRQTGTLPQELAIVFLFPAAMFLLRRLSFRDGTDRDARFWTLSGFVLCTAAIAAVHPGVAVPLVILCAVTVAAARPAWRDTRDAAIAGAAGIALGSTWMLAFLRYHRIEETITNVASGGGAESTAMYYFPFLRTGTDAHATTSVSITPVVIASAIIAIVLLIRAFVSHERRIPLLWTSLAMLAFLYTHLSSRYGLPEIVEVRRSSSWLAMTLALLIGVAVFEVARPKLASLAVAALMLVWLVRVPVVTASDRLIRYSGYSATAYTVLDLERRLEPFTWTLVTYGQEFPMVLGKGFHLPAADFLDRYDPQEPRLNIPTKYVYIVVEKVPHHFEINTWATKFSRPELQRRLQTWCFLYQLRHHNIRITHEDEHVRVYEIARTDAEVRQIAGSGR